MAAELVSEGKVRLNKVRVEKPSQQVKPGDVLTLAVANRVRILEVRSPGTRRGPATEAHTLYVDLTPPPAPRDPSSPDYLVSGRDAGTGRPTKRDRRLTDKLHESD
jgi:ribosome-associated heat shock protein Hsp15